MKKPLYIFLIVLVANFIHAQSGLLSRKNYGLQWKKYETKNFEVIFHEGLKDKAEQTARLAEKIYAAQSKKLGLEFKKPYKIYISSIDDIPNGFTTPFNYMYIWIEVSEYTKFLTGTRKWLNTVLAHEMVHALIMENTKSWMDFFFPTIIFSLPREINEGFAQYYSDESWGPNRGDLYLNIAIKNNNILTTPGSYDSGRLLYAKGFSKIKYLNMKYTDFRLDNLFKYRNSVGIYDWKKAFKKEFQTDYSEFCNNWEKYINVYYNWREGLSERTEIIGKNFQLDFKMVSSVLKNPKKNEYAIVGRKNKNIPDKRLYYYNQSKDRIKCLAISGINEEISFNKTGTKLFFSRKHNNKDKSIGSDIYAYDLITERIKQLTEGVRAKKPLGYQKGFFFVKNINGTMNLFLYNYKSKDFKPVTNFNKGFQIYDININRKYSKITFSFMSPRLNKFGFCVYNYKNGKLKKIYTNCKIRYPIIYPNNENNVLITVYEKNHRINIFNYDLIKNKRQRLTNQSNYIKGLDFTIKNNKLKILAIAQNERNQNKVIYIDPERTPPKYKGKIREYYRKWLEEAPSFNRDTQDIKNPEFVGNFSNILNIRKRFFLPYPFRIENSINAGIISYFSDDLGKNNIIGYIGYNSGDPKNSNYGINYIYRKSLFDLNVGYNYIDYYTKNYLDKKLLERKEILKVKLNIPFIDTDSFYDESRLGISYKYEKNNIVNEDDYSPKNYKMSLIEFLPDEYEVKEISLDYIKKYYPPFNLFPITGYSLILQGDFSLNLFENDYKYEKYSFYFNKIFKIDDNISFRADINFKMLNGNIPSQNRIGIRYNKPSSSFDLTSSFVDLYFPSIRGINDNYFGNNKIVSNLEARKIINDYLMGVVFFDTGFIWDNDSDKKLYYAGTEAKLNFKVFYLSAGISKKINKRNSDYRYFWYISSKNNYLNAFLDFLQ